MNALVGLRVNDFHGNGASFDAIRPHRDRQFETGLTSAYSGWKGLSGGWCRCSLRSSRWLKGAKAPVEEGAVPLGFLGSRAALLLAYIEATGAASTSY